MADNTNPYEVMKVLNLYAGIGGNRKLWEDVEVTSVEIDPHILEIYKQNFPNDLYSNMDAKEYLIHMYSSYDFIWASPPCQINSRVYEAGIKSGSYSDAVKLQYHDLSVYQIVLFLERYFNGLYCVENVEPFYTPLIPAKRIDRHLFWTNFNIGRFEPINKKLPHMKSEADYLEDFFGLDLSEYKGDKRQILRNCVHPETGLYILNCARNIITKSNVNQLDIFE